MDSPSSSRVQNDPILNRSNSTAWVLVVRVLALADPLELSCRILCWHSHGLSC